MSYTTLWTNDRDRFVYGRMGEGNKCSSITSVPTCHCPAAISATSEQVSKLSLLVSLQRSFARSQFTSLPCLVTFDQRPTLTLMGRRPSQYDDICVFLELQYEGSYSLLFIFSLRVLPIPTNPFQALTMCFT